jgi:endonuclease III
MTQLSLMLEADPLLSIVRDRLLAEYGPQRDAFRLDPVSQLVLAILSARTRDEVSLSAFERLARRYGSWSRLGHATSQEVESVIRAVTFSDRKADQLLQALRMIVARAGRLDLDFLAGWPVEPALSWLEELPGVGMRNAATTLNFSKLRKRAFSVDTHQLRVGERLGFLPPGADAARGFALYMRLVPDAWDGDDLYELHWLIKRHGQSRCRHVRPLCAGCPLAQICASKRDGASRGLPHRASEAVPG